MEGSFPKSMQGQTKSHDRSKVQEREIAKSLGGQVVKRSGAGLVKGDVRIKHVARLEAKTTANKSFSVNVEHIKALDNAVVGTTEVPIMSIEILGGAYKFCLFPESYLPDIIEALRIAAEQSNHKYKSPETGRASTE